MLETYLKNLIRSVGPISVARFMQEALSHPDYGYYHHTNPFGATGDFITAPEISQVFGELIGIGLALSWQQMGSPASVTLVELGPGKGTLMKDLLRGTTHIPGFHNALSIVMVETSPLLQHIQKETLAHITLPLQWQNDIQHLPGIPLLCVANEFFDALPVYQYQYYQGKWHEVTIGLDATGAFMFVLSPIAPSALAFCQYHTATIPEQGILECCPVGYSIAHQIASHIAQFKGAGIFIDYGYTKYPYHSTLQAVKSHRYHSIFQDIGKTDITAHVDFNMLKKAASDAGCHSTGPLSQNTFLNQLGLDFRLKTLLNKASDAAQAHHILTGIQRLVLPEAMGELFKALWVTHMQPSTGPSYETFIPLPHRNT